ncbi:hypothetical protein R6Q59_012898 [Mikania micrantha]
MATDYDNRRFPPQHQESQPGKEYLMKPLPQYNNPSYKPSNKLQVPQEILESSVSLNTILVFHILPFVMKGGTRDRRRFGDWEVCLPPLCYGGCKCSFHLCERLKGVEDIDASDTLKIINESKIKGSSDPIAIPADLKYSKNCKAVVDEVVAKYGHIDVLVNNLAVQYYVYSSTLEEIT